MDLKFEPEQFRDLMYNPFTEDGQSILDKYPILKLFPEFNKEIDPLLDKEQIIKYIMLLYQPNTPLKAITTIAERKLQAALLAGYRLDNKTKRFSSRVESVISCDDADVNDMIIKMGMLTLDFVYSDLMMYEDANFKNDQKILAGGTAKEKTKELLDNRQKLRESIKDCKKEFLNQDTNTNLIETLYNYVNADFIGISPEDIAKARLEGNLKNVLPNPWEDE